jgi:hypothetical protein
MPVIPRAIRSAFCSLGFLSRAIFVATLAFVPLGGCMTQQCNLSQPGTIDQQRRRAVRLDPYPDQRIGPEIEGGRPREYDLDRAEPDRAGLLREAWWGWPF